MSILLTGAGAAGTPATPEIVVSVSSLTFADTTEGTNSAQQSFDVSGTDLTTDITITPPTGFKISLVNGSGYASTPIILTPTGGTVTLTTIYVVFAPVIATAYSANITCSSTGALNQDILCSGQGTSTLLINLTASYSYNGNALKNVGANNGTATNVTYGTGAISGQCAVFNGTAKISVPDSTDFTLGSADWSFFIRVKRSSAGVREVFTGQSNSGGSNSSISFWLEFTTANKVQFLYNLAGTVTTQLSTISISDTNWHTILVVRNGTFLQIYIDNVLDVNANALSTSSFNDSSFPWGAGNAGDLSTLLYTGSIQDMQLWKSKVLTSAERITAQNTRYPFTV